MKTKVQRKNLDSNAKLYKHEKGITLIALIVTIVIMLILAGVTIKLATDDNGVIDNAKEAKNQYEQAQADEDSGINELSSEMKKYLNMVKGNSSSDQDNTTTVEGVTIPKGYYYVGGTKAKGIVISDSASDKELDKGKEDVRSDLTGNQWVWVPVDTPSSLYTNKMADLTGSTGVSTGRYTNTNSTLGITRGVPGSDDACEPDLVLDTNKTSYDYTEYSKAGFSSLDDMAETLVDDYYDMTVSIEDYKGFFIRKI